MRKQEPGCIVLEKGGAASQVPDHGGVRVEAERMSRGAA